MNLRPLGYEPSELPSCSTPRRFHHSTARWEGGQIGLDPAVPTDRYLPSACSAAMAALMAVSRRFCASPYAAKSLAANAA